MGVRVSMRAQKSSACWQAQGCAELLGWVWWRLVGRLGRRRVIRAGCQQSLPSHPVVFSRTFMADAALRGLCRAFDQTMQPFILSTPNPCNSSGCPSGIPHSSNMQSWHVRHPDTTSTNISHCSESCVPLYSLGLPWVLWWADSSWPSCAWRWLKCSEFWQVWKYSPCAQGVPPFLLGVLGSCHLFPPCDNKCPLPKHWIIESFTLEKTFKVLHLPCPYHCDCSLQSKDVLFHRKMQRMHLCCTCNRWIGAGLQTKADVCEDLRDACQGSLLWIRSCLLWC